MAERLVYVFFGNVSVTNFTSAEISANTLWHKHIRH